MPRANRDRVRVDLYVSRSAHTAIKDEARRLQIPANELYRRLLGAGWNQHKGKT